MFFNIIKEINMLLSDVLNSIKEINRLTKEINRLLSRGLSNIFYDSAHIFCPKWILLRFVFYLNV